MYIFLGLDWLYESVCQCVAVVLLWFFFVEFKRTIWIAHTHFIQPLAIHILFEYDDAIRINTYTRTNNKMKNNKSAWNRTTSSMAFRIISVTESDAYAMCQQRGSNFISFHFKFRFFFYSLNLNCMCVHACIYVFIRI